MLRVLYAEDNPHDADLALAELARARPGWQLETVDTGVRCLERLRQGPVDVLLLDHHLPDMDGGDVIRVLVDAGIAVPVVMVTGAGDEELVVRTLRLGASDYVPKRGDYLATLPGVLERAVAESRARQGAGQAIGPGTKRILYVEHLAMDIDLTLQHFAREAPHLRVEVVETCGRALEILGRRQDFDLVMIDLRMEDMTALEMLHEARHRGIVLPFVVITGKGGEEAAVAALRLGAYDYIVKRENYLTQLPYAIDNAVARFRLDQANRRMQADLAEINRELDTFAASLSHDLQSPLRAITGFSTALLEACGPALGEDGVDMLRRIEAGAERMHRLIQGMLAYSRVSRARLALGPVSLAEAVRRAVEHVAASVRERDARVTVEGVGGTVLGEPTLLTQAIANLVSNAVKFVPAGVTPEVRLWTEARADRLHLSVRDNGIGIAPEHQERIFRPLERLHGEGTYPGSGIGLAVVWRAMERMGGAVGVESAPGQGSCFWIELPAPEANP
jgi:signal transduction histidine kinase